MQSLSMFVAFLLTAGRLVLKLPVQVGMALSLPMAVRKLEN